MDARSTVTPVVALPTAQQPTVQATMATVLLDDPGQPYPTVYTRTEAYCSHCRATTDQVFAWLGYDLGQDTFCLDCGYSLIDGELVSCEINATCDQWTDVLDTVVPISIYDAIVAAEEFVAVTERLGIELAIADAHDGRDAAHARAACFLAHPARRPARTAAASIAA